MTPLSEEVFDVDPHDPELVRAVALAEQDHQLLRALVGLRKDLGLSQQDVADRIGISQPTVAAFEHYDSDPKLSTIRRYAQVVGLLVAHYVEVDRGQLQQAGNLWTKTWTQASNSVVVLDDGRPQTLVVAHDGTPNVEFALAA